MKRSIYTNICIITASFTCVSTASAAIMDSGQRQEKLNTVADLVSNEVEPLEGDLISIAPNPFDPDRSSIVEVVEVQEKVLLSDEELLAVLSEYINPTGIFLFGGEFYLVFKEKKLKVDSEIGVTYNGDEYSVTVTGITGSNYTISRGDAELRLKLK